MKVTDAAIDAALLQIFIDYDIHAGGRLLWSTLEDEWPRTHLRATDLQESLRRLETKGYLQCGVENEDSFVTLTPAGHLRTSSVPGLNHLVRDLRDFALFRAVGRRKSGQGSGAPGRRESDASTPVAKPSSTG